MKDSSGKAAGATSRWVAVGYGLVLLTSAYAFALNSMTLASGNSKPIVVQAVVLAALALLTVVPLWRRVPHAVRIPLALSVLANLWTLFDGGGRRLPALMGW